MFFWGQVDIFVVVGFFFNRSLCPSRALGDERIAVHTQRGSWSYRGRCDRARGSWWFSPAQDCPQSLVATLGRCTLGPPLAGRTPCRLRCRGAGWQGSAKGRAVVPEPRGFSPPGLQRLLQAFSQTEVLGIPAPGKDSLSSADGFPTQAALPEAQRRLEVGAETQLGGWAGGGGLSLFKPFPGLSSLAASSSHRLLGSRSRRFCRPPHHTDPAPGLQAEPARRARAAGTKAHLRLAADASIPQPPPPYSSPTSGPGPPGRTSRRGSHGGRAGGGGSHARKEGPPWGQEVGSAAIAEGFLVREALGPKLGPITRPCPGERSQKGRGGLDAWGNKAEISKTLRLRRTQPSDPGAR